MRRSLIFALIGAILIVIFAIQNAATVDVVKLWFWEIKNSPLALIILMTLAIGALLGLAVSIPAYRKKSKTIEQLRRKLEMYEKKESRTEEATSTESE
jgi:uncharacterized integral membrane protein